MWVRLLKTNLFYTVGSAANSAALFLLIPYLVKKLTVAEYGEWAFIEILILLVNLVTLAGMDTGLMREYWHMSDERKRQRLVGSVVIVVGAIGLLVLFLLSLPLHFWGNLPLISRTWQDNLSKSALWLALPISLAEAIFAILQTIFRIREEAKIFAALSFGRLVLFLSMAIVGVELGLGLNGALAGRLIAGVIGVILAAYLGRQYIHFSLDWSGLGRVFRYGLPMLPAGVASYILFASDRFVLQSFSSLEAVATYTFAYKIATVLDISVIRPFATDWAARRFKIASEDNAQQKYTAVLLLYLFVATGVALSIVAITPLAYAWLAPISYHVGAGVVPLILAAYLIYGLSYPLNIGIMLKDRTKYLAIMSWLAAILCLSLNFLLIPSYTLFGAAWATVLAYLAWTAGIAGVSLRLYPIRYPIHKILGILFAAIIGYGGLTITDLIPVAHLAAATALKAGWILIVFGSTGYLLWRQRHSWLVPSHRSGINGDGSV